MGGGRTAQCPATPGAFLPTKNFPPLPPDILVHEKLTYNDLSLEANCCTCEQSVFAQVKYLLNFQGMQLLNISGAETVLYCVEALTRIGHQFGKS